MFSPLLISFPLIPPSQVVKVKRTSNAATQSRQPRSAPAKEQTIAVKKPKDKNENVSHYSSSLLYSSDYLLQFIRNTSMTELKELMGAAVVKILQTKETFHRTFLMLYPLFSSLKLLFRTPQHRPRRRLCRYGHRGRRT